MLEKSVILLLSSLILCVHSQNCFLSLVPPGTEVVEVLNILETTSADQVLWTSASENIARAVVEASPHVPYIEGLRYSSRYDYTASALFSSFISTERTNVINRNVTFICTDDQFVQVQFKFILIDENTSPPQFEGMEDDLDLDPGQLPMFNFTVKKSEASDPEWGIDIINTGKQIRIRDMDLDERNADVRAVSTQSVFGTTLTKDGNNDHVQLGHLFNVDLSIRWQLARLGQYNFQVVADDGRFENRVSIVVDVLP